MEIERLLSECQYAELRVETSSRAAITIKDREIKQSFGETTGISVRVLENGSWGFASGNNIKELISKAQKLARLSSGKIKITRSEPEKKRVGTKLNITDTTEQAKPLMDAEKLMRIKNITSTIISCTDSTLKKEYYNSLGSEIIQESGYTYLSCSAIARSGENIQRGSQRSWSKSGFDKLDPYKTASEAGEKASKLLNAVAAPKGRYTVVLDPEMTGVFSHEALGHACEADSIVDRESVLSGKIGQQIGNSMVSIVDDPTAYDFGSYTYDDEGSKALPAVLVENGILKNFMTSMETAHALNLDKNGHARAQDYSTVPIVRMSNTYFQKGEFGVDEVFGINSGIYLKGMKGGSVDIFSGGFMFKAEEAYEIKKGEKGKMMRDVTITGNILETLMNVECVGNDFGTSPGICGKFGQEVPVSDGGPHIRIRNVAIG